MTKPIIEIHNISKKYRIGGKKEKYLSLRDEITRLITSNLWHRKNNGSDFWALKNVSLNVEEGEVVGIIGKNGAGKSTLLKILSHITPPTEGSVVMRGRVGSLLEVGTGFHAELTGRENIYLNGAILGMSRREINRKFDEIVAFSEIEKFLDTPVKRYSSGMYVRLAFSIAAHLEPEILLVDEVLAVGDVAFQKKCLGKMENVAKQGKTVIFVSHNMAAIRSLCTKGVLIDSGQVIACGEVEECIETYSYTKETGTTIISHLTKNDACVKINSVKVNGSDCDTVNLGPDADKLIFEIEGELSEPFPVGLEVHISDLYDIPLGIYSSVFEKGYAKIHQRGKLSITKTLFLPRMAKGTYLLTLYLVEPDIKILAEIPSAVMLEAHGTISPSGKTISYGWGDGWVILSGN